MSTLIGWLLDPRLHFMLIVSAVTTIIAWEGTSTLRSDSQSVVPPTIRPFRGGVVEPDFTPLPLAEEESIKSRDEGAEARVSSARSRQPAPPFEPCRKPARGRDFPFAPGARQRPFTSIDLPRSSAYPPGPVDLDTGLRAANGPIAFSRRTRSVGRFGRGELVTTGGSRSWRIGASS